jgi:phenylacetate-coenzyme A ligase PaaK-like adenylate-forming protein
MFSDLIGRPLNANAYEDRPFTFVEQGAHNDLANIAAIGLIENGERAARENWQNKQLVNLLRHAQGKSAFWRRRIPSRIVGRDTLKFLPAQSRKDIATQVEAEGSLMPTAAAGRGSIYASTGSTGTPVEVHITHQNVYYNNLRSLAQYFFYDLSFEPMQVKISPGSKLNKLDKKSVAVQWSNSWAGPLAKIFRNGRSKHIHYYHDERGLIEELKKDQIGYLVSPSRYVEILMDNGGLDLIRGLGVKLWLHVADHRDPEVAAALQSIGISSLSNYSAAEVGVIAVECAKHSGHFHIAHSNVIVECDEETGAGFDGVRLGRFLVTHLHSYATPIIRYDIGDFGRLEQKCACGHDGPVISSIYGRGKHFLRHPNGKLLPFYVSTRALLRTANFKECRVIQPQVDTIVVEIGGRETLTPDETAKLKTLIVNATDPAFNIEIRPVAEINWGSNPKRLFFSSAVA